MANTVLLESRSYRPFKSSEEYLYAMREDLAEWLNLLYPELLINTDNFMDRLDTGVALCKHAHNVRHAAEEYLARRQARNKSMTKSFTSGAAGPILAMGNIHFLPAAKSGTFFARDNVSNFIAWCRKSLQIFECLLFETDDLIMRKNEKHVILCLLEVARRGAKFGMLAPMLVQMERQIDREIAADNRAAGVSCDTQTDAAGVGPDGGADGKGGSADASVGTEADELFESDTDEEEEDEPVLMYGPQPQIITNDLKSLDEMVRDLVEKCTCPSQFPMVRVSEGKYRIGDTKVLIFVRILRSHVMVRVGGGWDTLSHYLDKHDPCRCKAQHRSAVAARLITRTGHSQHPHSQTAAAINGGSGGGIELHKTQVLYDRSPTPVRKSDSPQHKAHISPHHQLPTLASQHQHMLSPPSATSGSTGGSAAGRSRSPTPHRRVGFCAPATNVGVGCQLAKDRRSVSPAVHQQQHSASPSKIPHKQHSLDSNVSATSASSATSTTQVAATTATSNGNNLNNNCTFESSAICDSTGDGKFENISDNGSEISDEGYRSLGLIQNGGGGSGQANNNRMSLISQTSTDEADLNVRLEVTSTDDSQTSATGSASAASSTTSQTDGAASPEPPVSTETITTSTATASTASASAAAAANSFASSGVFITDDHIAIDIAAAPAAPTTNPAAASRNPQPRTAPSRPAFDDVPIKPLIDHHHQPHHPPPRRSTPLLTRRKSIDSSASHAAAASAASASATSGLSRKIPAYRSMRKTMPAQPTVTGHPAKEKPSISSAVGHTWSAGRAPLAAPKKRATLGADTFSAINRPASAVASATASAAAAHPESGFNRNSAVRASSQSLYDRNGRRVKSTNTSPTKSISPSPLAQQILEAAGTARNDTQMLEKMKRLLTKYTTSGAGKAAAGGGDEADFAIAAGEADFTAAWVNSNGTLDRVSRSSSCSASPVKQHSKRSSAASSVDSAQSGGGRGEGAAHVATAPRPNRGTSRIPAPIRQNTLLY